jgi:hypothetical protein
VTDPTLLIDGAEKALIGYIRRCGQPLVAVYDYEKLMAVYQEGGMTDEEAAEWIEVNVIGARVGTGTPGVLVRGTVADIKDELE